MVLQSIRDRLNGIIAIFILGLLVIPFAFVGVSSYFTSGATNAVALVNDQEITANEFNQAFQNYRRRLQAQMGTAFDPELFDQAIVRRQFLDQMINEELLAQVSTSAGLAVTDERLSAEIRNLAAFEVDGEFNADVYQQRLAVTGASNGGLLAGVNPVYGLYGYMVGTVTGALFTSSSFMAVQATGAMAIVVADVGVVHTSDDPGRAPRQAAAGGHRACLPLDRD